LKADFAVHEETKKLLASVNLGISRNSQQQISQSLLGQALS